jgi:alditol oxidase
MRTNWAGNYRFQAKNLYAPVAVSEVQERVRNSRGIKALGAAHSFNAIADCGEDQISLAAFEEMKIDSAGATVSVGAGVSYGHLSPYLDGVGLALHNLASLPHLSVAGACATGTHGSGTGNASLSAAVRWIEMVTADGQLVRLSPERDGEKFRGAVVGLGALGVMVRMGLEVQPRYEVRQRVYQNLRFDVLEVHLEEVFGLGYSVSLFTDWQNGCAGQLWVKRLATGAAFEPELFGAMPAEVKLHPLPGHAVESCTEQLGVAGPWYERLPHFRMEFTPSSGEELQSEYFVPLENGYAALRAVEELRDRITPLLFISEFRTVAADELWMSPCYGRASLGIHFTWKPEWEAVRKVLPLIEEKLRPFDARPHWAKLFTMDPARLRGLYSRLAEFRELARGYDPGGKLLNPYLKTNLFV